MHTSLYREKFWKRTSPICLTVINELWDSNVHMLSRVRFFATPWTVALQAPLSMGFSRREYWAGLPFPFPGDLPHPGIELTCLKSPALAGRFFTTGTTWDLGLIWCKRLLNTHKLFPPHTKPSSIYILHLQQQQKKPSTVITFKKATVSYSPQAQGTLSTAGMTRLVTLSRLAGPHTGSPLPRAFPGCQRGSPAAEGPREQVAHQSPQGAGSCISSTPAKGL